MTVDLRLQRAIVTCRSTAARLRQLAALAPDEASSRDLTEGAQELMKLAGELEGRLREVIDKERSYPLARKDRS